jgi:antitoxin ParD1/3/4
MSVTIAPAIEQWINEWIERGRYPDADSLLEDALRLLEERELAELRAKLQVGIDQLERGEGVPFTPELVAQIRRDADDRLRRGDRPNPDVCP